MVRLKGGGVIGSAGRLVEFQFHNGSIKRHLFNDNEAS